MGKVAEGRRVEDEAEPWAMGHARKAVAEAGVTGNGASPRQAAAKDASPARRVSPKRLDMTGVAVNAHARKANVNRND